MMNPEPSPPVQIEAQVSEYIPDAMTDIYKDNRFAIFDAVVLTITAPADMASRCSIVYLPQPTNPSSPLRNVGVTLSFHIAAEMLAPGIVIFESALHDLQIRQAPNAEITEVKND